MTRQTTRKSSSRVSSSRRVLPTRSNRAPIMISLVVLFLLLLADVSLDVQRVRYGEQIQEYRKKVVRLGSEVRDLEGRKMTLTSLAQIQRRARELGMVYPLNAARTLVVPVPEGYVPPTWAEEGDERTGGTRRQQVAQVREGH